MDKTYRSSCLAEERVLELGNKVLEVLGAEDKITDIEHFCMDSLYLQLFQALFPTFNFGEIAPGNTEEEMADNIDQLIKLLETNILDTDLSDIKAEGIVGGDLGMIDDFLQVLLQVVFLMVQNQAEGEESEYSMEGLDKQGHDPSSSAKKKRSEGKERRGSGGHSEGELGADLDNDKDETDTQKLAADLGLNSPDDDQFDDKADSGGDKGSNMLRELEKSYEDKLVKEGIESQNSDRHKRSGDKDDKRKDHLENIDGEDVEQRFSELDFYGKNHPHDKQVMIDGDEHAIEMGRDKKATNDGGDEVSKLKNLLGGGDSGNKSKNKDNSNVKKNEVDVLNDPLLPEGADFGYKRKNKARADSLGGGSFNEGNLLGDNEEDDDDLLVIDNLDELDEEQKYMVLQHLFEEYQKNPDAFPEDQKELLEQEMMKLYEKAELEGELDDDEFVKTHSASGDSHKYSDGSRKARKMNKWMDDEDHDEFELSSGKRANQRILQEDDSHDDERMQAKGEIKMPEDGIPQRKEEDHAELPEDDDEKYMQEIIEQQQEARAEREEEQRHLEQDAEASKESPGGQDADEQEHPEQDEHDGAMPNLEIDEEQFNQLPPEEQERVLVALQQQQEALGENEQEGEGDEQAPEVTQEYLNMLQQNLLMQQMQQEAA